MNASPTWKTCSTVPERATKNCDLSPQSPRLSDCALLDLGCTRLHCHCDVNSARSQSLQTVSASTTTYWHPKQRTCFDFPVRVSDGHVDIVQWSRPEPLVHQPPLRLLRRGQDTDTWCVSATGRARPHSLVTVMAHTPDCCHQCSCALCSNPATILGFATDFTDRVHKARRTTPMLHKSRSWIRISTAHRGHRQASSNFTVQAAVEGVGYSWVPG
jgi:hypothetical protein